MPVKVFVQSFARIDQHERKDAKVAEDKEINAMAALSEALVPLEQDAKARVLTWAFNRFDVSAPRPAKGTHGNRNQDENETQDREEVAQYQDFVDLFDISNTKTEADRALVGGYWFQVVNGAPSFKGREVNDALKDVGHGIGNITDALSKLQGKKPALVRQMAKSGRSRQAQKTYKLTQAGIRAVEQMISGDSEDHAAG